MRPDTKQCSFCLNPAEKKIILNPQTKVLMNTYLSATYKGTLFPVCLPCSKLWNNGIIAFQKTFTDACDALFASLVANKKKEQDNVQS